MKKFILLLCIPLFLFSCKNTNKQPEQTSDAEMVEAVTQELAKATADIRKPGEVADFFALSGTRFMPELINDPMNYEYYKDKKLQAGANIGAYLAGGLYQVAFGKTYEGYLSVAAAKQLAMELGIGEVLDEIIIERYSEDNLPSGSVLNSVRTALIESETLLTEKDQAEVFSAMLVGNYIEKLYLLFSNIFEYPVDLPEESKLLILRDMIVETGDELDLLPEAINIVEGYKTEGAAYLLQELKDLQSIREENMLTEGEWAKLTPESIFNNKATMAMYEKVKEARAIIIATE